MSLEQSNLRELGVMLVEIGLEMYPKVCRVC